MATPDTEGRVLVLMPTPRDAARTCDLLAGAGLAGVPCADAGAVVRELAAGAGVVLLADEALDGGDWLSAALAAQPAWSDLPLVVLTREGAGHASFREAAHVTLVERPVRMRTLVSVVRAALRARRHQYEVRDLLAERQRAAEALRDERERLRVTLASIGDAVISTDAGGRVTFLNGVAEALTGWTAAEAEGRPLTEVFHIVNEATRREVENPALRALREGVIVGLANHTVLIARDGAERPIDDSAAPIRDGAGTPVGSVLVFRDVTERRRVELDLARLAAVVASSDDAIVSTTLDGVIRTWNRGAERLFGYTAAEAVGQSTTLLIPPERLDEERAILARLARGEKLDHFETVRLAKDGRRLDVSLTVSPIRDAEGTVVGASKVARDVTDRARAEASLRASEARYRAIVEATPECVKLVAPDGTLLQMNRAGLAMVEGDESALGRCVYDVIAPEHRERYRAFNQRVCRGERGTLEFDIVGLRGTRRHMETTAVPLPAVGGGFTQLAVTRDVTARKRAEEAIRERDERLQLFLGNATDYAVIISDPAGRVVEWLGGAEAITGWRADEVRGEAVDFIFTPEDRAAGVPRRETGTAAETGRAEDTRWHLRKDGSRFFAEGVTVALRGPAGEPRGFGKVFRDATAQKLAQDALRDADRRKDDFIALLAHELRNPLAPIRNGLEVLRLSGDRAARDRSLRMMDRQLGHMVRLIDDLLDVSRIDRNKMELRRERISLEDAVATAVETARPAIEAAGHELVVDLPPEPVPLDADLTRLGQVFANLLTNSAKYTEPGGTIRLAARRDGGGVAVTVGDTGIGIPAAALPHVFEMFSQVDRSIERSAGGLGIGLALVKGLVEMHGGTVTAASGGEGRGSEFTVRLPTAPGRPAAPAAPAAATGPSARLRRRILVVDDNRDGAESLAEMLRLVGGEVSLAHDGVEAVERAEAVRPDVILMDVGMPRMNGLEATRRIRERPWGRGVTIIALTGWGQEGDRARSHEAGCDGHLVKPVSLADLERALGAPAGG